MRPFSLLSVFGFALVALARVAPAADAPKAVPTYGEVHAIFAKNCLSCHDAKEAEGELVLESHETLLKGGENGKVIVPGKAAESLLVKSIEQTEKPFMPPPKKGKKLSDAEIATIRAWIDAGALAGETGATPLKPVVLPKIAPRNATAKSINALAAFAGNKLYAAGLPGVVEIRSLETRLVLRKLEGHKGNVNDLAFSADGSLLAAAAGEPGVAGEVKLWHVADGKLIRTIDGHTDAIYSVAISPDGKILATGSYDQLVKLWDLESGKELRTLKGHNGCVFDLAFRPDGKVLASVSADRTLKLWDVATGNRLDTRPESLKDLFAVVFSPDGSRVYAAGVDNRIRVWSVSADAKEGSNKLLQSVFAHEGAILRLAFSPDGKTLASSADNKTVKLWNPADMTIRVALPEQPDWPTALALTNADLLVGRLDGSLEMYNPGNGAAQPPPPKPELAAALPRAIQRGGTTKLKLTGQNLSLVSSAKSMDAGVTVELLSDPRPTADTAWISVTAPKELIGPEIAITLVGPTGTSNSIKLSVDSLAQFVEVEPNDSPSQAMLIASVPAAVSGTLSMQGDADHFAFDFKAGQAVVIDVAANRIGSKADAVLALFDSAGNVVASNTNSDGSPDPLIVFTPPADGRYVVKVSDLQIGGSPAHVYRLSVGNFPLVTGVFPLGVPANSETKVRLLGYNLPPDASAVVKSGAMEVELPVPIDPLVYHKRRDPKVLVSAMPTVLEVEPNDTPDHATKISAPGIADGRIVSAPDLAGVADIDLYRFDAKKGQTWIVETLAARRGSPCDTKIEILTAADAKPVPRVLLRAVRDSYIEFRPIGPNDGGGRLKNWEEMELNEYLYLNGEVVKLFLAPRGPDSTWDFYTLGAARRCYFDTSASTHAMDQACYIVGPLPPGSSPAPNGLPVFPINYVNDDDSERKLGTDSRLTFVTPADGSYLVRVTDTRSASSDRNAYRLIIREAKPDFSVALAPDAVAIPPGGGVGFTVRADRFDNFDGDIRVDVTGLPPGFTASTPIVIQAGHIDARGTLRAAPNAAQTTDANAMANKLTATATLGGQAVTKPVNGFGKLTLGAKPAMTVSMETTAETKAASSDTSPAELTIAPGQMISAWLGCARDTHKGLVSFDVQNLPHGVIVADIGLSGVLIPEAESRRQIFITCAPWVPDQDRLVFARAREAGNPTSAPVLLHVRKPQQQANVAK